jgi:hypothetical protein
MRRLRAGGLSKVVATLVILSSLGTIAANATVSSNCADGIPPSTVSQMTHVALSRLPDGAPLVVTGMSHGCLTTKKK